jgi:hypothetical protein
MYIIRAAKRISGPQGKWKLSPPPPILQIMILKLSPPRCVISKEPVQKKWIDELWFKKQLSTCLFVWIFNYNSWAPRRRPDDHPLNGPEYNNSFHCLFCRIIICHIIQYRTVIHSFLSIDLWWNIQMVRFVLSWISFCHYGVCFSFSLNTLYVSIVWLREIKFQFLRNIQIKELFRYNNK